MLLNVSQRCTQLDWLDPGGGGGWELGAGAITPASFSLLYSCRRFLSCRADEKGDAEILLNQLCTEGRQRSLAERPAPPRTSIKTAHISTENVINLFSGAKKPKTWPWRVDAAGIKKDEKRLNPINSRGEPQVG